MPAGITGCLLKDGAHLFKSGPFFTPFTTHGSLATTSRFYHGYQTPTTKGAGRCCLIVERGHRSLKNRGEALQYRTSQDCFWLRQHPSYDNQGMVPAPLQRFAPGSHLVRTRWLASWSMSSSGYTVLMSVGRLTGG